MRVCRACCWVPGEFRARHYRLPHRRKAIANLSLRHGGFVRRAHRQQFRRDASKDRWSQPLGVDIARSRRTAFCRQDTLRTPTGCIPALACLVRPNPDQLARLRHLHQKLGRLVEELPDGLSRAEVVRQSESEIIHALVRCLDENSPVTTTHAGRNHAKIIRRLEEYLAENSFPAALPRGNMRGDRSFRKQPARVLPGASGHGPGPLSLVAPHASRATGPPAGYTGSFYRYPDRHGSRFLGIGPIFNAVSFVFRRIAFCDIAPTASAKLGSHLKICGICIASRTEESP